MSMRLESLEEKIANWSKPASTTELEIEKEILRKKRDCLDSQLKDSALLTLEVSVEVVAGLSKLLPLWAVERKLIFSGLFRASFLPSAMCYLHLASACYDDSKHSDLALRAIFWSVAIVTLHSFNLPNCCTSVKGSL